MPTEEAVSVNNSADYEPIIQKRIIRRDGRRV